MSRYIDADVLIANLTRDMKEGMLNGVQEAIDYIDGFARHSIVDEKMKSVYDAGYEAATAEFYDNRYQQGYADAEDEYAQKRGKWIEWGNEFKCDQCHCCNRSDSLFCPHCGADNSGDEEEQQ